MENKKIDSEYISKIKKILPNLLKNKHKNQWVEVCELTDDVPKFIEACEIAAKEGVFDNKDGWLCLEIKCNCRFIRWTPDHEMKLMPKREKQQTF